MGNWDCSVVMEEGTMWEKTIFTSVSTLSELKCVNLYLLAWFLTLPNLSLQGSHFKLLGQRYTCPLLTGSQVTDWFLLWIVCFDFWWDIRVRTYTWFTQTCLMCPEFTLNTYVTGPILADSLYSPCFVDASTTSAGEILRNRCLDILVHCQSICALKLSFSSSYFYGDSILVTVKCHLLTYVILIITFGSIKM